MFGGFAYSLDEMSDKLILYAEQSSHMGYDSGSYLYFEITESGSRMLEHEEREVVRKKFWELAKKVYEKRLRELKAMRRGVKEWYEPS